MKRYGPILLLVALAGCAEEKKVEFPPVPLPKDHVLLEPGPVDPDAPEEYTTTDSGLKYRIRRKSDGKKPTANDVVRVHYRGTMEEDGRLFDSSYGKLGQSAVFPVGGVVKGFGEGLQLIGEGGMIELIIRPELGYGEAGSPPAIPPNATLHFIVELIEIRK